MSRKNVALAAALAAMALTTFLSIRPSAADIVGVQRTSWGLATFGQSNAVANFDALGWAVEEVNGVVFAGGNFLDVTNGDQTERQPYLATFATSTGVFIPGFDPQVGGPVLALEASPDGGLFVGGEMGQWNGQTIGALAKIDPITGDLWPGWNTRLYGGTSVVRDLSLGPDGWLYAGGTFTTASDSNNPQTVHGVVRIDPDTGAIDWSWIPVTDGGGVWGVSASYTQPSVYVVGWNNVKGGQQVVALNTTDADQVTWNSFEMNYPCCSHVFDVQATPHGTVLVVGEQHGAYMYDENNNMSLMVSHATSYDSRYQATNTRRGGDYQDIEMVGDVLYASCHCWGSHSTQVGGSPLPWSSNLANVGGTHTGQVNTVIAYDARTGLRDQNFNPYMAGDIGGWGVLEASDGCLWIAGGINAVGAPGSQAPGRDLVRLCDENGPDPGAVTPPATCTATLTGDTVSVGWSSAAGAIDYVIYRTVDGGNRAWRGRTATVPFTDTNRDAELVYSVASRDAGGVKSTATTCATEIVEVPIEQLAAPTNCVATIDDGVTVTWDAVAEAAEYVVYRSVDGGTQFWRGLTAETSFADSNRDGQLTYYVAAKSPDLDRSERAECQTEDEAPPPGPQDITPVASCSVAGGGGDIVDLTVSWPAVAEADPLYIVYRTVDGGTQFWRGRTAGTSFDDVTRSGEIEYFVAVKVGNDTSTRTACEPKIQAN